MCVLFCIHGAFAQNAESAHDTLRAPVVDLGQSATTGADTLRKQHSPLLAGGASLIIPGMGQIYTGRYARGTIFLSAEAIMGIVAYTRYDYYLFKKDLLEAAQQEVAVRRNTLDQLQDQDEITDSTELENALSAWQIAFLEEQVESYNLEFSKRGLYNSLLWLGGTHIYNIMDAIASTNAFKDNEPRNPPLAGALSAIPFLGLGQIYNGAISKAGLVLLSQGALAGLAYNYDYLRREAEDYLLELLDSETVSETLKENYQGVWQSKIRNAVQLRNTYLWYGLLFYMYGIFDAVVDAHLHDIEDRMKLRPDLSVSAERVGLHLNLVF